MPEVFFSRALTFTITTVGASSTMEGTSGVDIGLAPTSIIEVQGFEASDILNVTLDTTSSTILMGEGNDTVSVSASLTASIIKGGVGDDFVNGFTVTNSSIGGGKGIDTIFATSLVASTIAGGKGGDNIAVTNTVDNNSLVKGGAGNDTIAVGSVSRTSSIQGGDGNDAIVAGFSDGTATAFGGEGNDLITAGDGGWSLFGEDGDDDLTSGAGDDRLFGGAGDDTLAGAAGANQLSGGSGGNTFVISGANTSAAFAVSDLITDWRSGTGNIIDRVTAAGAQLAISFVGDTAVTNANSYLDTAVNLADAQALFDGLASAAGTSAIYNDGSSTYVFIATAAGSGTCTQLNGTAFTNYTISSGNITSFS